MHRWGDENVDWRGIEEAAEWIGKNLSRWGRIDVSQTKEKYGEVRVYCSFGGSLYNLCYPYEYIFYPKLNKFQLFLYKFRIPRWFQKYQQWVYSRVYRAAIKKWPHLTGEILSGADWPEYLPGAEKYWERLK